MHEVDIEHDYETRGSRRTSLSQMDIIDANTSFYPLPVIIYPARGGSAHRANGKISSKKDEHSEEDSIRIKDGLITPPSSIKLTRSPPSVLSGWPSAEPSSPSSCSGERPSRTTLSPSKSMVAAKTNWKTSSKKSRRNKNNNEATSGTDDILGPFAHELQPSTREKLLLGANALRDQFGSVCPLQMAQLFWANSTLGAPHWPKLDQGERLIKKLRKNNSDLKHTKRRRDRRRRQGRK
ncbi:hypothetical protein E4U21_002741 [Claviceps maximensis]|nr:hypothetical protein E4U21_002741 [Claviceps maximensis]